MNINPELIDKILLTNPDATIGDYVKYSNNPVLLDSIYTQAKLSTAERDYHLRVLKQQQREQDFNELKQRMKTWA